MEKQNIYTMVYFFLLVRITHYLLVISKWKIILLFLQKFTIASSTMTTEIWLLSPFFFRSFCISWGWLEEKVSPSFCATIADNHHLQTTHSTTKLHACLFLFRKKNCNFSGGVAKEWERIAVFSQTIEQPAKTFKKRFPSWTFLGQNTEWNVSRVFTALMKLFLVLFFAALFYPSKVDGWGL